jgi:hypothetical protein
MTEIDGQPAGDAEHMPVRAYSIQWWSIRTLWALFTVGFISWRMDAGNTGNTGDFLVALALGAAVFVVLTLVAHRDRRIWAREHADDYAGTDRQE